MIRTPEEIEKMRRAGKVTAIILKALEATVAPGVTPNDLDNTANLLCKMLEVKPAFKGYRGFPKSVCISINNEIVHGIPNDRPFVSSDIVKIDFGVIYEDYYGDSALTKTVGAVLPEYQLLIDTTKKSLDQAIPKLVAGNHLGDVSHEIEKVVKEAGFFVVPWLCGHGIGKALHEEPPVMNYGKEGSGPKLEVGMVFAIEPIVNFGNHNMKKKADGWTYVTTDNGPSAHFEHTVAITENGPEILTKV